MKKKITQDQKHLIRLIKQDRNAEGWARVSLILQPIVKSIPKKLVEFKSTDEGFFVSLTEFGDEIINWV